MGYTPKGGHGYGNQKRGRSGSRFGSGTGHAKYDSNLARRGFEGRSKLSQKLDLHRFANVSSDIVAYLHSPTELDWQGVDDPASLAKFAEKQGSAHIVVKDSKTKQTHHFKVKKKTADDKKEAEKPKELAKSEDNTPILEKSTHKMPSSDEIFRKAQALYMAENFKPKYNDSEPEVLSTKGELAEIWAVCKKLSEQEAFENAFIINYERKNLSPYEMGAWICKLQEKFPEVYACRVHGFSFQETVGKRLGISQNRVSEILGAFHELENQKGNVKPENIVQAIKLPTKSVLEIKKAPDNLKSSLFDASVENNLSVQETIRLSQEIIALPEPTPQDVDEAAKKIADEKAVRYMKEADKEIAKTERARDKVVAAGEVYPEALMTAVFGHLGLKSNGKVAPEAAKAFAKDVVDILVNRAIEGNELDSALAEADLWKK